ncbi:hypothetical protein MGYG_05262 [Nannizzia gypsea CBS 118893]|uniref:KRAB domain-containing protein n=1 Tax=Arthroderma gypseum (strain ATCC MYA-4604 / CBS 118893) TaxID=535722 RepID=E4UVD4_ARTGP|nr:hypothetical protein MGYG_05262 [Nannizzia gypsea CBS 118893]EFR02261.1 hypothetical protein MGYG_05262 [Nannizzia gypsea CBS 118893]
MDPLSATASVIGIIQLTGAIVKICGSYIHEVKNAKQDIISLQQEIVSLAGVLEKLSQLLHSSDSTRLAPSQTLVSDIIRCLSTLEALKDRVDPGMGKKLMGRLGVRALKWPLQRDEVEKTIKDLERYISLFTLSLQVDQTTLMTSMLQTTDHIDQKIDLERLPIAHGAEFDSYMDQHEGECLPNTRTEFRREIAEWAVSPKGKCIFWLNGMAGTGKSTISRTVAKSFKEENLLGASFFFKRGEGREECDEGLKSSSHQALNMVVVVDALDECERDGDIRLILQLLPQVQQLGSVQLRFFLTSRPELPIRLGFRDITDNHQDLILHEIPRPLIEHDISLFLKHRLSKIRKDQSLSDDWPGDTNIKTLAQMSVPLFIFAATVCRVFEDQNLDPEKSLAEILQYQNEESKLNGTYLPVLNRLDIYDGNRRKQLVEEFREVIGVIILLEKPLSVVSLSELIGISKKSIYFRLRSLYSVLSVPEDDTQPVRLFHLSFRDFLLDTETRKKSSFWIDEKDVHRKLTIHCINVMQRNLKKNICNLPNYGTQRSEIDMHSIDQYLPAELQYSCRYWVHHLAKSEDPVAGMNNAFSFLQKHFLHWLEAMGLLGIISEVVGAISTLQSLIRGDRSSEISEFIQDAKQFTLKNRQMVDTAPLQLYNSGLVFAPRTAVTRKFFEMDFPKWLSRLPNVEETWSAHIQALEGHGHWVTSVAFSPNGQLLASSSLDKTVRLWETATGALYQTLEGHDDGVTSVVFSPDGRLLASASRDTVIRLWDMVTGALQQTFEGHDEWIEAVAFSIDGQLLASSCSGSFKLWDVTTRALKQTIKADWYGYPVFSPDGRLLAVAFHDNTIRLWDAGTGAPQRILKGHRDSVNSIKFSPDGQILASSSDDGTIILWDAATGAPKRSLNARQIIEDDESCFSLVAFSPDSQLLALCFHRDTTITLWDTITGAVQQVLEGHRDSITEVAFSPDGRLLASSSDDNTVRLWDMATRAQQTLKGHEQEIIYSSGDKAVGLWDTTTRAQRTLNGYGKEVISVTFSPDGQLLASISLDGKTVELWNVVTGALKQTLEGESYSMAFSSDGRLLASGSYKTVRLWNVATGVLQLAVECHSNLVLSVAISPNGQLLASSSMFRVKLCDVATGLLLQTIEGHNRDITSMAFSPDNQVLASGSKDKTIKLWKVATGVLQQTLSDHRHKVTSVAFSPDGRLLASGSRDKTLRLWDAATGASRHIFDTKDTATSLKFSEDGSYLNTNLGSLSIRLSQDHTSFSVESIMEILILDQWLTLKGENVLWLPPEYRPTCVAFRGRIIALGHVTGQVSFLEFCMQ